MHSINKPSKLETAIPVKDRFGLPSIIPFRFVHFVDLRSTLNPCISPTFDYAPLNKPPWGLIRGKHNCRIIFYCKKAQLDDRYTVLISFVCEITFLYVLNLVVVVVVVVYFILSRLVNLVFQLI